MDELRPDQRRGQRAREIPSVAEINRRAEGPPRPRHPILDMDRHRVQHRQGVQHRGDYVVQNNPNTYQDSHRRHHSSVEGRGPISQNRMLTPSMHNHHGTSSQAHHVDPRHPCPQCTGSQYSDPQYPGLQFPGPQSSGSQPAFPQQTRGVGSTYRPNIDEYGIPQATDYFPPLQEVFGRSPLIFNNQMVAGPPEPQAGIPNSMAPFDSTAFQQGYNAPYFSPNLGYGAFTQGRRVSPDPFRSLLSTPYLLPAPLLNTPNQEPALIQGFYQHPSEVLSSSVLTHEQTGSHAARNQEGNLYENQTTIDPQDLTMVQHSLRGPLGRSLNNEQNASNINVSLHFLGDDQFPAPYSPHTPRQSRLNYSLPVGQTPDIEEWHGAQYSPASAVSDPQSGLTHPVSQQQLQAPTRPRVPRHQGESQDNHGQGSAKRKRRENSSPEDGASPTASAQIINPKNDVREHFLPRREEKTPTGAQTGKNQNNIVRLKIRPPSQAGTPSTPPSNERHTGAMVTPETVNTGFGYLYAKQQRPYSCDTCGKPYVSRRGLQHHHEKYCKRDNQDKKTPGTQTLNFPEAESGLVVTDHRRPAEITNRVLSEGVPDYNQSGDGNGEQQLVDNAPNPSPLAQDSGIPSTPPRRPSAKKPKALQSPFFDELDAYNGVVAPSKLEPGEAPRVPSWSKGQQLLEVGAECPICGTRFGRRGNLQQHFVACARKNGNPDGRYWDELLEDQ